MRALDYKGENLLPRDEPEGCYECGMSVADWEQSPIWWQVSDIDGTPTIHEGYNTEGCDCEGVEYNYAETTVAAFVAALKSLGLTA